MCLRFRTATHRLEKITEGDIDNLSTLEVLHILLLCKYVILFIITVRLCSNVLVSGRLCLYLELLVCFSLSLWVVVNVV